MRYMIEFARECDFHLKGKPDMQQWAERMRLEVDNVRAALRWHMQDGNINHALILGAAMHRFWGTNGFSREGGDWLKQLSEHPRAQGRSRERAYVLTCYARSLRTTNDAPLAPAIMEQALGIFVELNDEADLAYARFSQGDAFLYAGKLDAAIPALQQALAYYNSHPKQFFLHANVLSALGRAMLAQKDFTQAYEYIDASCAISKEQGDKSTYAWNLLVLGDIAYAQNHLTLAREKYEASLELYRAMNRYSNTSYLLEALGSLAYWRNEPDLAIQLLEECFRHYKITNNSDGTAFSHGYRASIEQERGNLPEAARWLQHAATPLSSIDDIYRSVFMIKLADYAAACGDTASAAALYLAALRLTSDPTTVLFPPDRRHAESKLDSIRRSMSEADFRSAEARAESLSIGEAVRLVFPDSL
jgi:tetratricopeptide (TPR) repeat protein